MCRVYSPSFCKTNQVVNPPWSPSAPPPSCVGGVMCLSSLRPLPTSHSHFFCTSCWSTCSTSIFFIFFGFNWSAKFKISVDDAKPFPDSRIRSSCKNKGSMLLWPKLSLDRHGVQHLRHSPPPNSFHSGWCDLMGYSPLPLAQQEPRGRMHVGTKLSSIKT